MAEQQAPTKQSEGTGGFSQVREIFGIVIVIAALFVYLSLVFHEGNSTEVTNKTGEYGAILAQLLLHSFGYGAYLITGLTLFFGCMIFLRIHIAALFQKITAAVIFIGASLLFGALLTPENFSAPVMGGYGGSYGYFFLDQIEPYVGRFGAYMSVFLVYTFALLLGTSLVIYPYVKKFFQAMKQEAADLKPAFESPSGLFENAVQYVAILLFLPFRCIRFVVGLLIKAVRFSVSKTQSGMEDMMKKRRDMYDKLLQDRAREKEKQDGEPAVERGPSEPAQAQSSTASEPDQVVQTAQPEPGGAGAQARQTREPDREPEPEPEPATTATARQQESSTATMVEESPEPEPEPSTDAGTATEPSSPSTSKEEASDSGSGADRSILAPDVDQDYDLPPLSLLKEPEEDASSVNKSQVEKNKEVIQKTLDSFGIDGEVVNSSSGPVITMYEVELAPGVQVSKLISRSDDLAIALKASSVRIVYPIPGKSTVGIEAPNSDQGIVRVRELWDNVGNKANDYHIPLLLGRSADGEPVHMDLADMPHLLIAGTTGSGKSVCLKNIVINQLLCRTPQELKLLMVDPKMVELTRFEGIPHLICPIIKNMKKVSRAFEWLVDYMEERYKLLQLTNCTDLDDYNALSEEEAKSRLEKNGMDPEMYPGYQPRIIAVVDELGDLMSVSSQEVETTVTRIAQKARAVGIHMILSTQRPSSEVITGLIKANIPARISFKVMSGTNSRIIIDQNGAEDLIGDGDMLLSLPDKEQPIRSQGALIEADEIEDVCSFWKDEAGKLRNDSLPDIPKVEEGMSAEEREMKDNLDEQQEEDQVAQPDEDEEDGVEQVDEKFEDAVDVVVQADRGSVSLIQRKLQIGYTRAARIMEQMEEEGLVGPHRGNKPRQVLIDEDEWRKLKEDGQML